MKIVADENLSDGIIELLRTLCSQLISIRDTEKGADDFTVTEIANTQDAIIITEDKDFGELTYQLKVKVPGIVLVRLSGLSLTDKCKIIKDAFLNYDKEFKNSFTVIAKSGIRIRALK